MIDGMPLPTVVGHAGDLYAGEIGGVPSLVFAGRCHLYEVDDPKTITFAVATAIGAGCEVVVLTNAAGGIDADLEVGAPCLISDHLNLTGRTPLSGPHFVDLTDLYDEELRALARSVDGELQERVYAGLRGPAYETPAEVAMLATLGADLVGMSTVLEAITARAAGARVLGISIVTNLAAGVSPTPLSHDEVAEAGRRAAPRLTNLLRGVVGKLG